ncbi:hypothetical protein BDA96_03G015800 [Sorghum bicolor]|jgi:hypothetical protein|uniref:DUF7722 domain-containing protein n=2 Tax=Sorghum bicolor TaxID=4558 RepID=A0A921RBF2_SORBI|nr:uncharacterized protein LOC8081384 [Sorghum bicolor]EES02231.1 hypothetical protein SORBI_3003G014400 [Sorghum bicolor]KAG0535875.1 hypothetical protein BDA96_03G015800 [Sorghum bicolor]|eukprot:XP_002457111.1 uncharacterized protein LOC8081384 [Sorghum bicolor]
MAANGGVREAARYGAGSGKRRDLQQHQAAGGGCGHYFQMPLHYPRYSREDYEAMPEWQLDRLLSEYGLPVAGTVHHKRTFAMGAFLWAAAAGNNHS